MLELVKDPYERKARVTPALLVALPVMVPLVCVYGTKNPLLTGVLALLCGCGVIYLLANIARGRGKVLEKKLVDSWGGMPTTIALRHRDKFLDSVSKGRYHKLITDKLGIQLPSASQEEADRDGADNAYIGATKRLRELTRNDKRLLLKENMAYGFHRNMLAMKSVGILTSLVGIIYGLILAKVVNPRRMEWNFENLADPGLASAVTLLISVPMLLAWLFYFNGEIVRTIGFTYAERLFECLPGLKTSAKKEAVAI